MNLQPGRLSSGRIQEISIIARLVIPEVCYGTRSRGAFPARPPLALRLRHL